MHNWNGGYYNSNNNQQNNNNNYGNINFVINNSANAVNGLMMEMEGISGGGCGANLLIDYQLLPFVIPPSLAATAIATSAAAVAAAAASNNAPVNSSPLFIPSLFGCVSPAGGPQGQFIISANSMAMGTAASLPSASSVVPPQHRKLFIGGLNHETTDDQLRDYYSKWGHVVDCIVIRDPISRNSRGFGFVTYTMPEMADAAMADRPHTIGGKIVDPKRAIPREQMLQAVNCPPEFLDAEPATECKLILSGIHWDFHTVDALRHHFEAFGDVEQVEIVANPRGYGFVVFEEREAVERCLAGSRSHSINGRKIEVRESEADEQWPVGSSPIINRPRKQQQQQQGDGDECHQKGGNGHSAHHYNNIHHHVQQRVNRGGSGGDHQNRRFGQFSIGHGQPNNNQNVRIMHHHGSLGSQGQGSQSHSPVESMQSSEPESPTNC